MQLENNVSVFHFRHNENCQLFCSLFCIGLICTFKILLMMKIQPNLGLIVILTSSKPNIPWYFTKAGLWWLHLAIVVYCKVLNFWLAVKCSDNNLYQAGLGTIIYCHQTTVVISLSANFHNNCWMLSTATTNKNTPVFNACDARDYVSNSLLDTIDGVLFCQRMGSRGTRGHRARHWRHCDGPHSPRLTWCLHIQLNKWIG